MTTYTTVNNHEIVFMKRTQEFAVMFNGEVIQAGFAIPAQAISYVIGGGNVDNR